MKELGGREDANYIWMKFIKWTNPNTVSSGIYKKQKQYIKTYPIKSDVYCQFLKLILPTHSNMKSELVLNANLKQKLIRYTYTKI